MQSDIPTRPWKKLGIDIFECKGLVKVGLGLIREIIREPRTFIVDINGKVYYRTREYLKLRYNNMLKVMNILSYQYNHTFPYDLVLLISQQSVLKCHSTSKKLKYPKAYHNLQHQ